MGGGGTVVAQLAAGVSRVTSSTAGLSTVTSIRINQTSTGRSPGPVAGLSVLSKWSALVERKC